VEEGYTESRLALGVAYLSLGKWDQAIEQFEIATSDELFGRPWEIYNNIGWAYLQKGQLELAEVNIRRALRENQNFCPAYCNLGEIYSKKGLVRDAITNFRRSISICGESYARPHFLLGLEFGKLGRTDMACEELARAARIKDAAEAEQALDYMRLYNCPGVMHPPTTTDGG